MSATLTSATPILFTGLAAAAAFRMQLFNIGAEGKLYLGAVGASWIAHQLGDRDASSTPLYVVAMCIAAGVLGAAWALIPGVLKAFARTNEIITSLMLNYVAGLLLTYLIFDSASYWRDTSTLQARSFPGEADAGGVQLVDVRLLRRRPARLPRRDRGGLRVWVLYFRMRFGFEVGVMADSPRAARYAGMRTRRKILAVMAVSGAIAGIGGSSQIGDFTHTLDGSPTGLQAAAFGYTGIVVAALARYNPFAVCLVAVLIGGLQNAGYTLQGTDFPSGLVGVMQGIILFCALGGELLLRYRLRITRARAPKPRRGGIVSVNDSLLVIVLAQAVLYGTPLLYAALGELLAERAGVLNLGVQGMMLFGAAVGFWITLRVDGSSELVLFLAVVASALSGAAMAAIHAFLVIALRATRSSPASPSRSSPEEPGLSAYVGTELGLADVPATHQLGSLDVLGLGDLPVLGPILFDQSALVYGSWILTLAVAFYLGRTRWGLNVRAVGEAPASADAMEMDAGVLAAST